MDFFPTINSFYVFIGSTLLGALGGMVGSFAVLRKQGLLGDTLAHAALPGIVLAFIVFQEKNLALFLLGALFSGLLGAWAINGLMSYTKIKMDTAMASVLSVFFALGIMLLTFVQKLPLASQSGLDSFLFGQAAALLAQDVYLILGVFVVSLVLILFFWKEMKLFTFDPLFAQVLGFRAKFLEFLFMTVLVVAILLSLQAVGVVLTAAVFITPAVSALLLSKRLFFVVLLAALFGAFSGAFGAYFSSIYQNLPTGPMIVLMETIIFLIAFFFAPNRGFVAKWGSRKRYALKVQIENLLANLARAYEQAQFETDLADVDEALLQKCLKKGYLERRGDLFALSEQGLAYAMQILEKHRLWETYLVSRWRLPDDHVHRDAHDIEHILNDDLVLKLKAILGDPKLDPHGKPINLNK